MYDVPRISQSQTAKEGPLRIPASHASADHPSPKVGQQNANKHKPIEWKAFMTMQRKLHDRLRDAVRCTFEPIQSRRLHVAWWR